MRISDWSSNVCTSGLNEQQLDGLAPDIRHRLTNGGERRIDIARHLDIVEAHDRQRVGAGYLRRSFRRQRADRHFVAPADKPPAAANKTPQEVDTEIGRASCRTRAGTVVKV